MRLVLPLLPSVTQFLLPFPPLSRRLRLVPRLRWLMQFRQQCPRKRPILRQACRMLLFLKPPRTLLSVKSPRTPAAPLMPSREMLRPIRQLLRLLRLPSRTVKVRRRQRWIPAPAPLLPQRRRRTITIRKTPPLRQAACNIRGAPSFLLGDLRFYLNRRPLKGRRFFSFIFRRATPSYRGRPRAHFGAQDITLVDLSLVFARPWAKA